MKFVICNTLLAGLLIATCANADVVTLTFDSSHAITGDVDGTLFASSDWAVSIGLDDTSADTDGDPSRGIFDNPVLSAQVRIDADVYDIATSNFANTQLLLYDFSSSGNLNSIAVYMDAGGINFSAGNGAAFNALFSDNNDISTANTATSSLNSDGNQLNYPGDFSFSALTTTGGETINVDFSELGVNTTTVSAIGAVAVPERNGIAIAGLASLLVVVRRMRI